MNKKLSFRLNLLSLKDNCKIFCIFFLFSCSTSPQVDKTFHTFMCAIYMYTSKPVVCVLSSEVVGGLADLVCFPLVCFFHSRKM